MGHSTKKLSKVCIWEHKQNAKILNMRNTLKKRYSKFRQKQVFILIWQVHRNMKRNSLKRIYERLN